MTTHSIERGRARRALVVALTFALLPLGALPATAGGGGFFPTGCDVLEPTEPFEVGAADLVGGVFRLDRDHCFETPGAAITIATSGATIDLNGFSIEWRETVEEAGVGPTDDPEPEPEPFEPTVAILAEGLDGVRVVNSSRRPSYITNFEVGVAIGRADPEDARVRGAVVRDVIIRPRFPDFDFPDDPIDDDPIGDGAIDTGSPAGALNSLGDIGPRFFDGYYGDVPEDFGFSSGVLLIGVEGATVRDVTVEWPGFAFFDLFGFSTFGIAVGESAGVAVLDSTVNGATAGIILEVIDGGVVRGNAVTGAFFGIVAAEAERVRIDRNRLARTLFGIAVGDVGGLLTGPNGSAAPADVEAAERFERAIAAAEADGVIEAGSLDGVAPLAATSLGDGEVGPSNGDGFDPAAIDVVVERNSIGGSAIIGIAVFETLRTRVDRNTITDGLASFFFFAGEGVAPAQPGTPGLGIVAVENIAPTVTRNRTARNTEGIVVMDALDPLVHRNIMTDELLIGLVVDSTAPDGGYGVKARNSVSQNRISGYGYDVAQVSVDMVGADIRGNRVSRATGFGHLVISVSGRVNGNSVDRARESGFLFLGYGDGDIEPPFASAVGPMVNGGPTVNVSRNRATRNGGFGFYSDSEPELLPGRRNVAKDNGIANCVGVACRR
jgi:hypothetical protein